MVRLSQMYTGELQLFATDPATNRNPFVNIRVHRGQKNVVPGSGTTLKIVVGRCFGTLR
jgi:hypothetical protein